MPRFDHEKLTVYQRSVEFVVFSGRVLSEISRSHAVFNQFDRASTSIPLNIAEGNGKYTPPDRCRFFDIARGSALECAACLDVMVARQMTDASTAQEGKKILLEIVPMLVGLIRANAPERPV